MVLVDQQRHDIHAACRAALHQTHVDAHTREQTAHRNQQNRLQIAEDADRTGGDDAPIGQPLLEHGKLRLKEIQPERQDDDAEDRLDAELPSDHEPRDQQQDAVDQKGHRTDPDLVAEQVFDGGAEHERETRRTSARTVCGDDAGDPCERIEQDSDGHHEILPDAGKDLIRG